MTQKRTGKKYLPVNDVRIVHNQDRDTFEVIGKSDDLKGFILAIPENANLEKKVRLVFNTQGRDDYPGLKQAPFLFPRELLVSYATDTQAVADEYKATLIEPEEARHFAMSASRGGSGSGTGGYPHRMVSEVPPLETAQPDKASDLVTGYKSNTYPGPERMEMRSEAIRRMCPTPSSAVDAEYAAGNLSMSNLLSAKSVSGTHPRYEADGLWSTLPHKQSKPFYSARVREPYLMEEESEETILYSHPLSTSRSIEPLESIPVGLTQDGKKLMVNLVHSLDGSSLFITGRRDEQGPQKVVANILEFFRHSSTKADVSFYGTDGGRSLGLPNIDTIAGDEEETEVYFLDSIIDLLSELRLYKREIVSGNRRKKIVVLDSFDQLLAGDLGSDESEALTDRVVREEVLNLIRYLMVNSNDVAFVFLSDNPTQAHRLFHTEDMNFLHFGTGDPTKDTLLYTIETFDHNIESENVWGPARAYAKVSYRDNQLLDEAPTSLTTMVKVFTVVESEDEEDSE